MYEFTKRTRLPCKICRRARSFSNFTRRVKLNQLRYQTFNCTCSLHYHIGDGWCSVSFLYIQCLHSVTNFTQALHTCSLNLSQALPSFPTQYFMEFSCAHLQAQWRRISPPLSMTLALQLASVTRYPTTSRRPFLQYLRHKHLQYTTQCSPTLTCMSTSRLFGRKKPFFFSL